MKKVITAIAILALAGEGFAQGLLNRSGGLNRPNRLGLNRPLTSASTGAADASAAGENRPTNPADPGASKVDVGGRSIEFNGAALDIVLMVYGNLVGKTVLKDPSVPAATITLQPKQGQELTDEDKILAIETVLEMNSVHLEPYGEKFVRALPRGTVRKDGIPLIMDPDAELGESTKVVSLMLTFRNIALDEAQKALEGLKSDKGVLNVFERTSSILVTDTEMNIQRMREIAKTIDVPTPVTENVFIRQIKNAAAQDIKTALEAIVQESQKELEKQGKQAKQPQRPTLLPLQPRTLLGRPGANNQPPAPTVNESLVTSVSDADRGMIRGKVLILSDERSNKLIIVTSQSNMNFFDKVIEQLDVETTPDTVVKVYRLKYADSEDVSDMINDLIGNAASTKSSSKGNQNQAAKSGTNANVTRNRTPTADKKPANQRTGEAKAGELSKDNTTVLADKRINGLVVMTNKELVPVIEQIIESMDIKLSQVLIETVIIEVTLGDTLKTGIDWVRTGRDRTGNSLVKGNMVNGDRRFADMMGGGGGTGTAALQNLMSFTTNGIEAASAYMGTASPIGSGLNYLFKSDSLNLAAVVSASKTDNRTKYIASPVIMTVDNKEAIIEATDNKKFLTDWQPSTSGGGGWGGTASLATPKYDPKDIGIKLTVKPKINPNGTVMLEVKEEYSQTGGKQTMLVPFENRTYIEQEVDIPSMRSMEADVLLENAQTVVFGGMTETMAKNVESGIPILKDIPWIGKWLFGKVDQEETRKELLVFMTPYVLDDAESAQAEAIRRKKTISDPRPWDDRGWSASALADPVSKQEQMRRLKDEAKSQDEERKTKMAIEKWKVERVKQLKQMSKEERDLWLEMHKEELSDEAVKEELEKKMEDEGSDALTQEELKKLAASLREKKLAEAEKEIKSADKQMSAENERGKLDTEKAKEAAVAQ